MFVCSTDIAEQEQNKELAERYKAKKDDFPVYKLFLQGRTEPIDYTGNKKSSDEIIRFIVAESGNSLCSQLMHSMQRLSFTFVEVCACI